MQYQNVFAPLIKLEADYDKVSLSALLLLYEKGFITCVLFSLDDERVSEQGQSNYTMGHRAEQEAHCLFCISKGLLIKKFNLLLV